MINWILRKLIARLDNDINDYRRSRKGELQIACTFYNLGKHYEDEYYWHIANADAYRANIEWCIKWRNRMARRVGIPTIMAW